MRGHPVSRWPQFLFGLIAALMMSAASVGQICRPMMHDEFLSLADRCHLSPAQFLATSELYFAYLESSDAEGQGVNDSTTVLFPKSDSSNSADVTAIRRAIGSYRSGLARQKALDGEFFEQLLPLLSEDQAEIAQAFRARRAVRILMSPRWMRSILRAAPVADIEQLINETAGIPQSTRAEAMRVLSAHDPALASILNRIWERVFDARIELEKLRRDQNDVDFDQVTSIYEPVMEQVMDLVRNRDTVCRTVCGLFPPKVGGRARLVYLGRCDKLVGVGIGQTLVFVHRLDALESREGHAVDVMSVYDRLHAHALSAFEVTRDSRRSWMIGEMNLSVPGVADSDAVNRRMQEVWATRREFQSELFTDELDRLVGSGVREASRWSQEERGRSGLADALPPTLAGQRRVPNPIEFIPDGQWMERVDLEQFAPWDEYLRELSRLSEAKDDPLLEPVISAVRVMGSLQALSEVSEAESINGFDSIRAVVAGLRDLDARLLPVIDAHYSRVKPGGPAIPCVQAFSRMAGLPDGAFTVQLAPSRATRWLVRRGYTMDLFAGAEGDEWPEPLLARMEDAFCRDPSTWVELSNQIATTNFDATERLLLWNIAYAQEFSEEEIDARGDAYLVSARAAERAKVALSEAFFSATDGVLAGAPEEELESWRIAVERTLWPEIHERSEELGNQVAEQIRGLPVDSPVRARVEQFNERFSLLCRSLQVKYCEAIQHLERMDPLDEDERLVSIAAAQGAWEEYLNLCNFVRAAVDSGRLVAGAR